MVHWPSLKYPHCELNSNLVAQDVVKNAESIEQVIKMEKIEGSTVDSRTVKMTLNWETLIIWSSQVSLYHRLLKCLCQDW
jgi:hypothetical protein